MPKIQKPSKLFARARRRARRRRRRRSAIVTLFKLGLAAAILWGAVAGAYYAWALTFDLRAIGEMPQRSVILDRHGRVYAVLGQENRVYVPFSGVSEHFVSALITREDTRFYSHRGVDPVGIVRAAVRNLVLGGIRQGGSTITQQLARNSFPLGGRNFHRKLIEAALAFRIETELTKEEILEAYVNRIYFGSGYYGIETASRAYFGKPAVRLGLSEAALLAGLIRAPSRLSPYNDLEGSVRQRDVVLRRMFELELIGSDAYAAALAAPVVPSPRPAESRRFDWAVEAVERELENKLGRDALEDGGLEIRTGLDPEVQAATERALARRLGALEGRAGYGHPRYAAAKAGGSGSGSPYVQGAALAVDNRTGGICAVAGSRDVFGSRYNRAFLAERQAGSTAKPFLFAAAFELGLKPSDSISDARIGPGEIPRQFGAYDPANHDGKYDGRITVAQALSRSRNPASVRVALKVGLDRAAESMRGAGLSDDVPRFPSVALGAFETTLDRLVSAYTAFANEGVRREPYLIERVSDARGRALYEAKRASARIMSPTAARLAADALRDTLVSGTGSAARSLGLTKRAWGKTGTTNQFVDAWFVGGTRTLTAGVWVGFDSPKTILDGASAASVAMPVWVDIVQAAPAHTFPD